jgi:hypothetical protein
MAWDHSAIFRQWIAHALAPHPTFRYTGPDPAYSGWNLPPFEEPNAGNRFIGVNEFRCCLFGDDIDTMTPPAEEGSGGAAALGTGTGPTAVSPFQIARALPAGAAGVPQWQGGGQRIPRTGQDGGYDTQGSVITFGGDNVASNGVLTMAGVHGDLVFNLNSDLTGAGPAGAIPFQGVCFHWYGGEAGVTDGTFTVVWPSPERVAQIQLVP